MRRLNVIDRKVPAIIDYDNFTVLPDAMDAYFCMVQDVTERYYSRVSRYTTSAFLRSKLGETLRQRGVAPHIFETALDARRFLGAGSDPESVDSGSVGRSVDLNNH